MSAAPEDPGVFLAPLSTVESEIREKGSRFIGILLPVADPQEAATELDRVRARYPDATHHCWAYRIGWPPRERSSDDGEPSGTAGAPILGVLAGRGLSDVLAVVVRWFGGTKLGKGGLARAYSSAVREAFAAARLEERFSTVALALDVSYQQVGAVRRLLRPPQVELVSEVYGERVQLVLRLAESVRPAVEEALADLGVFPSSG